MDTLEVSTAVGKCVYMESTQSEGDVDLSRYDSNMLGGESHFICGLTMRKNGPDYRPVSPEFCKRLRSCFKTRGF